MNTKDLNFSHIAPRNGSKEAAFEEFCCQIAEKTENIPPGSTFSRYRGAGGDGGVECVWRLPDGSEWGWQVKYIFDLNKAKPALDASIKTALVVHPKLTRYIICIPFDLTGPTGRKGKSETTRFAEYCATWGATAKSQGINLKIELTSASQLTSELLRIDPNGGRRRYWFDETILSDQWFERHLHEAEHSAGPRYTRQLNIETPTGELFEALGMTKEWQNVLSTKKRSLDRQLNNWTRVLQRVTKNALGEPSFPIELKQRGEEAASALANVISQHSILSDAPQSFADFGILNRTVQQAISQFEELSGELAADLNRVHGPSSSESVSFRQFQTEYNVSFPAANLDACRNIVKELSDYGVWLDGGVAEASISGVVLLHGEAGSGKTHVACDAALSRLRRGFRTVVLFGERFTASQEPWREIALLLGIDLGREALLEAMDSAGAASGGPLLLLIDGLNETRPRTYWSNHLAALVAQASRYKNIRVCITCRTTYLQQVLPTNFAAYEFKHRGFEGMEFEACRAFFSYYNLAPPVAPILQPEFSNPLFLRLMCEATQATGQEAMPAGWRGFNTLVNVLLRARNAAYARQFTLLPNTRFPERGLQEFVKAMLDRKQPFLSFEDAEQCIDAVLPHHHSSGSLIQWLVEEGLLIVDAMPADPITQPQEYVRIAFERLGEHLLASMFLDTCNGDPSGAFKTEGSLHFCVAGIDAIAEHAGLLEALSIQIPERFRKELVECLPTQIHREPIVKIAVQAYPWRDPEYLDDRACDLVYEALRYPDYAYTVFDALLSLACIPSSLDALWTHDELARQTMAQRDGFWCGYLHSQYTDRGPVSKLLRAAFVLEVFDLPEATVERWATMLLWFTAAADRRVRDTATKALVVVTEAMPHVWNILIRRFTEVDDEYVIERCFCAAYGTLLRNQAPEALRLVVASTYGSVFVDSKRFQNALIRDHARCILQLAEHVGVLPDAIHADSFMPPYQSDWPLAIPTDEQMARYENSYQTLPKLLASCTDDDFFIYTISRLYKYEDTISRIGMGRWIFSEVLRMGYSRESIVNYDKYTLWTYGGGRSREHWAERIGKKYQWIALARLAARLADHVTPKDDEWTPQAQVPALTYEDGRDTDPSIVQQISRSSAIANSWWQPVPYDFAKVAALSDADWTADHEDMPDSTRLIGEHVGRGGRKWLTLEEYPDWTSKSPDSINGEPYRHIWMHIRSYLVPREKADACWRWFKRQQFFGGWMLEGPEFNDGFIGEYPWATSFQLYPDRWHSRGQGNKYTIQHGLIPTTASIIASYEYDAYQDGSIIYHVPTRIFFESESLIWNRVNGYSLEDGRDRFLDPSIMERGPRALLVDMEYLQEFLQKNHMSIVWAILGEKQTINVRNYYRLTYSRAHILTDRGLKSSQPVVEHYAPTISS